MRNRSGAAAVECALLLPVLLILVFGAVDFGRFVASYIVVTNSARAGAGFGSTHPYTPATYTRWQAHVQKAVVDEMSSLSGFDVNRLAVTITAPNEGGDRWRTQVEVSYPFQTLIGWPGVPTAVTLRQMVTVEAIR